MDNPQGIINPTTNKGIINLKSFSLSYSAGKSVNSDPNITGNITRLGVGSSNAIPIELNISLNRRPSINEVESIKYLTAWSRNATTVMLFYMPNTDTTTLYFGQENDFYYSQLRTLYDTVWDKNLGTNPFSATTYGSSRYYTGATINSLNYNACALPCVFNNITVKEDASSIGVDVSFTGFVLENEEQ